MLLVVFLLFSGAVAAERSCTNNITVSCNITQNTTLLPGIYKIGNGSIIDGSIVVKVNDSFLDCNGATLVGNRSFTTLRVSGKRGFSIRNCTFINSSAAVSVGSPDGFTMEGNTFTDINLGLIISGNNKGSLAITGNKFLNSSMFVELAFFNNTNIWDNLFTYRGITYQKSHDPKIFCKNGIGNRYESGAIGPGCTCLVPLDELQITGNTTFCPGTYKAVGMEVLNLLLGTHLIVQCNGTIVRGNLSEFPFPADPFSSPGISIVYDSGTVEVKNCIFTNYTEGIADGGVGSKIVGNTFTDNKNGIYTVSNDSDVRFNNFLNNVEADVRYDAVRGGNITLPYNWWGTADPEEISKNLSLSCLEPEETFCVNPIPFLTEGPEKRQFDLSVLNSGISFQASPDGTGVLAEVFNQGNVEVPFVQVSFLQVSQGAIAQRKSVLVADVPANGSANASTAFGLSKGDTVMVIADPDNEIRDDNRGNNRAQKQFLGLKKYFIAADVPPTRANQEILDFVKENLKDGILVENENDADFKILIARHNPLIVWHFQTVEERGWGFMGGGIKHKDTFCDKPYCAIIGNFDVNGKKEIYIEGNDVDGFIAAAKRFIKEQDVLKEGKREIFVGGDDIGGISVFDFLHNANNKKHYKEDSNEFGSIVRDALNENMVEETQINTTADGVTLRLLRLQPAFSKNLKDFKDTVQLPVVLARGLWSNLNSWQGFGAELASTEARDTWLIEITGGPGTDCAGKAVDDCPDYSYNDLTDSYVPALLNKVLNETNKTKLQYVGFSNGCRSALSSLEKGSFDPAKVDTFVGVGCPGNFSGDSLFASCLKNFGEQILNEFEGEGIKHITQKELGKKLGELSSSSSLGCYLLSKFLGEGEGKISKKLAKEYSNFISNNSETQPGKSLSIDKFSMMYGIAKFQFQKDNDLVVTEQDAFGISNEIISERKALKEVNQRHDKLPDSEEVKDYIVKEVRKN